jgi:putative ABC transport system permease protein
VDDLEDHHRAPAAIARSLATVHVEATVLLWSAGISVMTGILFGCAPAMFAGARSVGDVLRSETRGASGAAAARRLRSTLIVLEIAMSLVLLVGAGLLVRSFIALQRMPLGFEPRGLVYADVMMVGRRDWSLELRAARQNEILERLRAIPGVTEASIGMMPGQGWMAMGAPQTEPLASGQTRLPDTRVTFITPDFFRIARMTLAEGRPPDSLAGGRFWVPGKPEDMEILVNRSLARRLWPDGRVLGARIGVGGGRGRAGTQTVVGSSRTRTCPGRALAGGRWRPINCCRRGCPTRR